MTTWLWEDATVDFAWKVVSWLCWNRFFSSCDCYSIRRGRCCQDNGFFTSLKGSVHNFSNWSCFYSNPSPGFILVVWLHTSVDLRSCGFLDHTWC
ncbi:unnamed protein product [Urochloa humidicola]